MTHPAYRSSCRLALRIGLLLLLAGCAGNAAHRQGIENLNQGKLEEALAQLERASKEAPDNREFRMHYLNAQAQIVGRLLADAQAAMDAGNPDAADALFRRVLALERGNALATAGLAAVEQGRRHNRLLAEANAALAASQPATAEQKIALILVDNPRHPAALALRQKIEEKSRRNEGDSPTLHQRFQKPVTLEFRDTPLKQVLEALSKHSGLNFVFDKDVPPTLAVNVFLKQVSVEEALDVMLTTNQLRKRVLNDQTLLIYPDTAAKLGEHQGLVVKNIFLANAEAKQVVNMLKTVLKAKNVFADDKLNLLIMRDTPEMIRLAERMVSIQDVGEPEVMLEMEVLEIQRSRLLNLGVQFPSQLTLSPLPSVGSVLTLRDLQHLNASRTGATITPAAINLQRTVSDTNLLANPRIRTHNREKALIRIGDRVPVITTTATSTGFVSENVQYIDVGLKLEVEPTIYPNDEISIKVALEVSSVTKEIISKAGTVSYQIGGRNASTVLRLKDGETQILGGLINDQDVSAANRFPGLGDLPVLGRLFSSQKDSRDKTELVLSITPRLVHGLAPPPQVPSEFWSGTESDPRLNTITAARNVPESTAKPPKPGLTPAPDSAAKTLLYWDGPSEVKAGDFFKMKLKVSSGAPISRLPVQIAYDTAVFTPVEVLPGKFMRQGDVVVDSVQRIETAAGMIFLTQERSGKIGASGEGELFEVQFRALKAADSSFISVLPTLPLGPDQKALGQAGPTQVGISVLP